MPLLLLLSEVKIFQRTNKLRSHSFEPAIFRVEFSLAKISSSYLINSCFFFFFNNLFQSRNK